MGPATKGTSEKKRWDEHETSQKLRKRGGGGGGMGWKELEEMHESGIQTWNITQKKKRALKWLRKKEREKKKKRNSGLWKRGEGCVGGVFRYSATEGCSTQAKRRRGEDDKGIQENTAGSGGKGGGWGHSERKGRGEEAILAVEEKK